MQQEDVRLVAETLKGDPEAFRPLVEKYQSRLYDLALRMTGSIPEAEDIAQAAFIRAYSGLKLYDPTRSFFNWLYTIALNITRNRLRRKAIINFFSLERFHEDEHVFPEPSDRNDNPEESITRRELSQYLDKAIRNLSVPLREAFVLFHFHGADVKDIAAGLGVSQNAVSLRLLKARKSLYSQLSPRFPEYFTKQGDYKEASYGFTG